MLRSSPDPEVGRSLARPEHLEAGVQVAILARPGGRTQHFDAGPLRRGDRGVAILARPGGRTQHPVSSRRQIRCPGLRSSPDPEVGRSWSCRSARSPSSQGCDPRPTRRSDAAGKLADDHLSYVRVAILARPGGRTQHACRGRRRQRPLHVAILARPGGRTQQAGSASTTRRFHRCDPRPTRRSDAAGVVKAVGAMDKAQLRSSPDPEVGRSAPSTSTMTPYSAGCDPRPTRRSDAATASACRSCTSRWCCDPRPTRRSDAALPSTPRSRSPAVLRSSPDPEVGRSREGVHRMTTTSTRLRSSPDPEVGRSGS